MRDDNLEVERKVSMGQKIAFGFGMLANQMFPASLQIFMVILVQDLGFAPHLWGLIFFLPRFLDAITDPIMGFISDNTRSKWGEEDNTYLWEHSLQEHHLLPCGKCMRSMERSIIFGTSFLFPSSSI